MADAPLQLGPAAPTRSRESTFYRTLDREGVDLFLCGEVHDSTALQHGRRGPLQISHGSIFRDAFPFLVGRLYEDGRLKLDLYETLISCLLYTSPSPRDS